MMTCLGFRNKNSLPVSIWTLVEQSWSTMRSKTLLLFPLSRSFSSLGLYVWVTVSLEMSFSVTFITSYFGVSSYSVIQS